MIVYDPLWEKGTLCQKKNLLKGALKGVLEGCLIKYDSGQSI